MYDVHSHILPGLDDGAKTVEEFVAMARAAVAGGTTVMLATPHRRDVTENFSIPYLRELAAKMVETLAARGVGLTLVLGMENHLDVDLPEALSRGTALPMNGTRHVLVELPFFGPSGLRGAGAVPTSRRAASRPFSRIRSESSCCSGTRTCCAGW